jgi:outer membrane protein insertion porin family
MMLQVAQHRVLAMCAAVLALAALAPAFGQTNIETVRFEPAAQPLPEALLYGRVKILPGAPLDADQARATIEALFETGRYSDIQISSDGPRVTIRTEAAWFIGRVTVSGVSEPPNQAQMVGVTGLRLGEPFYEDSIAPAESALLGTLRRNGFYTATVRTNKTLDALTQQVSLEFIVTTGPRAKFTRPVISGASPMDFGGILNTSRWRSYRGLLGWKSVTEARVNQGLERIRTYYADKNFLLNQVSLTTLAYLPATRRVVPSVAITPGPVIEVRAQGLSQDRLRRLVPIYQEQSVDRDLLNEGTRNIVEYLRSQGFFDSMVSFNFVEQTPQRQIIQYDIVRGERHKLRAVFITGNKYFDSKTITERMGITAATRVRFRNGRFSESLLAADTNAIRDLYISNGFRDVVVNTRVVDVAGAGDKSIEVNIEIVEGQQWLVESVQFEGVDAAYEQALRDRISSQPGQPFSESVVAIDRDQILSAYFDSGYADAAFDWAMEPGAQPKRVVLTFTIREGQQRTIREVFVSGLETSRRDLVNDRITLRAGDVLSQAQMLETQRRLYDLGVFARVDTALQNPDGDESSKNVVMQFEEARRYAFNFGFGAELARIGGGVGNFSAVAGQTGFAPRVSASLSRYNFLGVGHTVTLQARISTLQQRELLSYLAPHFIARQGLSLTVTAYNDLSRNVQTFTSRRQEVAAQLSQTLGRGLSAQGRFAVRRNSVDTNTIALSFPPDLVPIFARPVRLGMVSGTVIRDRRDDPIDARRGTYNYIDIGYAAPGFGGQPPTTFVRVVGRNSSYHRVGRDIIFARSFAFGFQRNLNPGGLAVDIPLAERIFSGGSSSHRGFPENQAGPRDATTGFPVGGGGQLFNNLELRFPLLGEFLGGVLFHDAGNVYTSLDKISFASKQRDIKDFDYMVHAVGIGFRLRTPVGPVRADFAYVPNAPRFFGFQGTRQELISGGGQRINQRLSWFQFHISLGQAF